jgi:protein-disulfide isomerase
MITPPSHRTYLKLCVWLCLALLCALGCAGGGETQEVKAPQPAPQESVEPGAPFPGEPQSLLMVEADDAVLGDPDAPVTLIGFLDYQCPFCARGFETMLAAQKEYGPERLRVVVKHLPLEFHPDALPAAVAAQAVRNAGGNEAFFKYSEILMQHQRGLAAPSLADWATQVGVEREAYNEQVAKESTVISVANDARTAGRLGIDGTPAFFVNGASIPGAQPIEVFRAIIDAETKAMEARRAAGEPWAKAYQARVANNLRGSIAQRVLAEDPRTYRVPVDGSPSLGPADAPVTLVEFSDFECPYCKKAHPTVDALRERYGNKLRVVFKQLPLPFHKHAEPAARVADAIHRYKGDEAFWKSVNRLFAASPALDDAALIEIGKEAGLTEAQVKGALEAKPLPDRLVRDATLAEDIGANGTPHFFVNGKRLGGAYPQEAFEAVIDFELEAVEKLLAAGAPKEGLYDRIMQDAVAPGAPQKVSEVAPEAPKLTEEGVPVRGPKTAPVVIHVFSDFECPYCRRAEKTLVELEAAFPGKVRFVWHNLPLSFHQHARPAARASLEAFAQKGNAGFWKMHAALFDLEGTESSVEPAQLTEHAKALGLDMKRFEKAVSSDQHDAAIAADEKLAQAYGFTGTPAFVVGDYVVTGARPLSYFTRVTKLVLEGK